MIPLGRTGRFASHWISGRPPVKVSEVFLEGSEGARYPTSKYTPASLIRRPRGAWILLHGLTRPGRHHTSLVHFARSLAASGSMVLVPEIAAWRDLDLGTGGARQVVLAACDALESHATAYGRPGLMGFSFGGPQVVRMAADPDIGPRLAGVATFGGFGNLTNTLRYQMTGVVESEAGVEWIRPDPYARWIFGANLLTDVPGWEEAHPVTHALKSLATTAGDRQVPSWDSMYDGLKADLRAGLSVELREAFDLFAPSSENDPPGPHLDVARWIDSLGSVAQRRAADLEVAPGTRLEVPVHILHGRFDPLIPWTEAAELASRIDGAPRPTITPLFAHSARDMGLGLGRPDRWAREVVRLGVALSRVMALPG